MQELADLYGACSAGGLHPPVVDAMELWEVAGALGLGRAQVDEAGMPTGGRDIVAERLHAAEQGLPPPEPDAPASLPSELATLIPIHGSEKRRSG